MPTERAEKILSLQLEWVKAADSKVPPLFAINIAMLGVMAALIKLIKSWTIPTAIVTAICTITLLLSVGCLVLTMFPRLGGPKGSNIFFGGISKKAEDKFITEVTNLSDSEYQNEVLIQAYRNAEIAVVKYEFIKLAFIFTFAGAPIWLFSIYLLYV